jgi:YVTN family beta-propeller protein
MPRPLAGAQSEPLLSLFYSIRRLSFAFFAYLVMSGGFAYAQPAAPAPNAPIFVLNSLDANISVIDPRSWAVVKTIPTGKEPHHLYLTPDEKSVIVANAAADSLTFIDPRTAEVQRVVRNIIDPYHLRFSPDMKWLITVANRLNHIDLYRWDGQTPTLVKRLASGKTPSHIWIDSKSTTVYTTMQDSNELVAVDLATQSIKWRVPTGALPADVFGTPDDRHLLVANTGGFDVQVYDITANPARLVKTLRTGEGAHAFRALGDGRHVWVSNRVADTISRIDYQRLEVVDEIKVPGGPDCMEVTPDGKLLVSSRWVKRMTVVDTASGRIERQVKVGKSPHGVWTLNHTQRQ